MAVSFTQRERTALRMRDLPFFRLVSGITLLIWILSVTFPTWRIIPLIYGQDTVPLHYNIHYGVDSVGLWWKIYLVPLIGLVILLINYVMVKVVWKREQMLAYLIAASTLLLEFLLFIAMVFIVLLNISYG